RRGVGPDAGGARSTLGGPMTRCGYCEAPTNGEPFCDGPCDPIGRVTVALAVGREARDAESALMLRRAELRSAWLRAGEGPEAERLWAELRATDDEAKQHQWLRAQPVKRTT